MLYRLSRVSFWLAAAVAAFALVAPGGHATLLTGVALSASALAFGSWRSAVRAQRRHHRAVSTVPEPEALGESALGDATDAVVRLARDAVEFDAALHAVADVLRAELGARQVVVSELRGLDATHAHVADLVAAQPGFRAVARRVRLTGTPLGEALRSLRPAGTPPGAVVVPVVVPVVLPEVGPAGGPVVNRVPTQDRSAAADPEKPSAQASGHAGTVVAVLELVGIEVTVAPVALAGLLDLAGTSLSARAAVPGASVAVDLPSLGETSPTRGWSAPAGGLHHPSWGQGHVLVVEHNDGEHPGATPLLRRLGCRVTQVSGLLEASELLGGTQFDLVLLDTGLPGAVGAQPLGQWREARRAPRGLFGPAPVIAISAQDDGQRLRESGFDDQVFKPLRQDEMLSLLNRHLRRCAPADSQNSVAPGAATAAGPNEAAAVLDAAALARLAELDPRGESRLIERVLLAFQTSVARLRPQAEAARAKGDRAGVRLVVHTLKSSSARIGAVHLAELSAQIETQIRLGDADHLDARLDAWNLALDRVMVAIAQLLKERA